MESPNLEIVNYDHISDAPVSGYKLDNAIVRSFNSNYEVLYSLNGGDSFVNAGEELEVNNLINYQIYLN